MIFYEIIKPWEPEILGIKDGLSQANVLQDGFKDVTNYKAFMELFASWSYDTDKIMNSNFELECVKLRKKAKITDFLWFAPMSNCLLSKSVIDVFQECRLGANKLISAFVETQDGLRIGGYTLMYNPIIPVANINYKNSLFLGGNNYDGFKEMTFYSQKEYSSFQDFKYFKKIVLVNVEKDLDIYNVAAIGTIISEKLYSKLMEFNVTGVKFRQLEVTVAKQEKS